MERNGNYVRHADGSQTCEARVTLTFQGAANLSVVWTYPAVFAAKPFADHHITQDGMSIGPGLGDLSIASSTNEGTTSVEFRLNRIPGTTDFASGNTMVTNGKAAGAWA